MPIRAENRWLYPIDWDQLSCAIRFARAGARCERCRRPHRRRIAHLGDGRWWDAEAQLWRSGLGRRSAVRGGVTLDRVRTTYVVLACAHLDHNPGNNAPANLAALCQRCHMLHDAAEHRWQRWWNAFRRRAIRDLFEEPPLTRRRLTSDTPALLGQTRRTVVMSTLSEVRLLPLVGQPRRSLVSARHQRPDKPTALGIGAIRRDPLAPLGA